LAAEAGGVVAGVIAVGIAILLIWAFYPVIAQLGGTAYGILFVILAVAMVIAAVVGVLRGLAG